MRSLSGGRHNVRHCSRFLRNVRSDLIHAVRDVLGIGYRCALHMGELCMDDLRDEGQRSGARL